MDEVKGRRKRGAPVPKPMAPMPMNMPKPGTKAFGDMAWERRENIKKRAKWGDLRIKTAYQTAKEAKNAKNKIIAGD